MHDDVANEAGHIVDGRIAPFDQIMPPFQPNVPHPEAFMWAYMLPSTKVNVPSRLVKQLACDLHSPPAIKGGKRVRYVEVFVVVELNGDGMRRRRLKA